MPTCSAAAASSALALPMLPPLHHPRRTTTTTTTTTRMTTHVQQHNVQYAVCFFRSHSYYLRLLLRHICLPLSLPSSTWTQRRAALPSSSSRNLLLSFFHDNNSAAAFAAGAGAAAAADSDCSSAVLPHAAPLYSSSDCSTPRSSALSPHASAVVVVVIHFPLLSKLFFSFSPSSTQGVSYASHTRSHCFSTLSFPLSTLTRTHAPHVHHQHDYTQAPPSLSL